MKKIGVMLFGSDRFTFPFLKNLHVKKDIVNKLCLVTHCPITYKYKDENIFLYAEKNKIKNYKNEEYNFLDLPNEEYEIGVIASFGKIIPQTFYSGFKYGMVNVHPSLLPKYRGSSPIQSALFNNEKDTGLTIAKVTSVVDGGDIIMQKSMPITDTDNYTSLLHKLSHFGSNMLIRFLEDIEGHYKKAQPQRKLEHGENYTTLKIDARMGKIEFCNESKSYLMSKFRSLVGYKPIFTAFGWNGQLLRIEITQISFDDLSQLDKKPYDKLAPGDGVFNKKLNTLLIKCSCGNYLAVLKIRISGKPEINVKEFVNRFRQPKAEKNLVIKFL